MNGDSLVRLNTLGVILTTDADARTFLQGQLTADLDRLGPGNMLLAACNSPQGRVQAVLRLVQRADGIALILPSSMIEATIARLRKYVLRAKVGLHSAAEALAVHAMPRSAVPSGVHLERTVNHSVHDGRSYLDWSRADDRVLVLARADASEINDAKIEAAWRLAQIRAGLPQVYPQTSESFVAQMLNLDLLDGISFEKGCYTGQEIIARTHFRGAIKRRMFRFASASAPPAPGTRVVLGDQHAGEVVDAAPCERGCELLAVVNLAQKDQPLTLEGASVPLQSLPMSYEVPP